MEKQPSQHVYNVCLLLCVVLLFGNLVFMKWSLEFQMALQAHGEVSSADARNRAMAALQELYRIDNTRIQPLWGYLGYSEERAKQTDLRLESIDNQLDEIRDFLKKSRI